jgi:PIN domain nuclease of toxin-antitoxin system
MRLLLDTQIIVWIVLNDKRFSAPQRDAFDDGDNEVLVSPVISCELAHLQQTGRLPLSEPIDRLQDLIGFELIDLPQRIWQAVSHLPDIHRDPIDRMLIAHALVEGMTLVTADANIRRYPVPFV